MNSGTSIHPAGGGAGGAIGAGFNRQRRIRGSSFNSGNVLAAGVNLNVRMCVTVT